MTGAADQDSTDPDTATAPPATAGQAQAPAGQPGTLAARIRRSLTDSAGSIVFGMEDGTVSTS